MNIVTKTATVPPQLARVETTRPNILARHPLLSYFVLAYAVTWLLWLPGVLLGLSQSLPAKFAYLPGVLIGITGVAFLMTYFTEGPAGVRRLAARYVRWRVGWWWYAFVLIGVPFIIEGWTLLLPGNRAAAEAFSPLFLLQYPGLYAILFIFGPFCEEVGWRGFALPRLQARYGPLLSTLILGILWGMWHLPLHLASFQQDFGSALLNFSLAFGLATMAYAVIQTWLFNATRGNLLLLMLAHGSINASFNFFANLLEQGQLPESFSPYLLLGVVVGPVAFALGLIGFTWGRLGYSAAESEAQRIEAQPSTGGR